MIRGMASRIFPIFSQGEVVKGFGRGSKQLGIPTAWSSYFGRWMSSAHNTTMPQASSMPLFMEGPVERGYRRGGSELAMPTANFPDTVVECLPKEFDCGIYFGWASVDNGPVNKMVMSIGWNPFYKNTKKTMETHIIHDFKDDFYGANLKVCVCGYLRAEKNFSSLDALIEAIRADIQQAQDQLDRPQYKVYREDSFFLQPTNHKL